MRRPRLGPRLLARWRSLPPRTIRLRLTAVYGALFLLCGAALLGVNYGLVSGQLTAKSFAEHISAAGKQEQAIFIHRQGNAGTGGSSGTQTGGGVLTGPTRAPAGSAALGVPTQLTGNEANKLVQLASPLVVEAGAVAVSHSALGTLLIESGIALAIMALLAAGLGWVVAGRALRPLRAITATAQEISASNLHRRLALAGPDDELRQLGHTFDALLERLETAFAAQRQFAANVSHELRTPLTYERTLIEVALGDPRASTGRLRAVLEQVLAAGEHQERLIDALLVLSRSQRGLEVRERIDLAAIAGATLAGIDAGELTVEGSLAPAFTEGDPRLVERLVVNLVTNAVQHNRPGGRVEVTTHTAGRRAVLAVTNTGPVVLAGDLERLFEPFQRLDGARESTSDGLGLGLSIVKAIADAHGATITTAMPADGGLAIEVRFPGTERPRRPTGAHPQLEDAAGAGISLARR